MFALGLAKSPSMRAWLYALWLSSALLGSGCATRVPELGDLSHLAHVTRTHSPLESVAGARPRIALNELQLKGSHNSYHRAPRLPLSRTWRYSHAPLEVQLASQSVRQLELDVRYTRGELIVGHLPFVDGRSSCVKLVNCLARIRKWSRAHPSHLPVFVMIEVKDDLAPSRLEGKLDAIDFAIKRVFNRSMLLTPADVAQTAPTLRDAIVQNGWPTLEETRGQVAFVMFGPSRHKHAYSKGRPRLEGRVMFVAEDRRTLPHSSVLMYDDPIRQQREISEAVRENFLVRTRADSELRRDPKRRDAALASGANFISTDFADPRTSWVELGGRAPGRCNPVTAPASCSDLALAEQVAPAVAERD